MAASNGIFEAGTIDVYIDSTLVAYGTNANLSVTPTLREIKNKTDGRWTKRKQGRLDANGNCNVLYALLDDQGAAIHNLAEVFADILAGTEVTIKYTNANTGDKEFTGKAQISGLNVEFGDYGENAQGDFSWMASDPWSLSVIS